MAARDGFLLSCKGELTRRKAKSHYGICSSAEITHADRFKQFKLGSIEPSSGPGDEIVTLIGDHSSDVASIKLSKGDAIIFCTGQRNSEWKPASLSYRFAQSGVFSSSGVLNALIPMCLCLEQLQTDAAGMTNAASRNFSRRASNASNVCARLVDSVTHAMAAGTLSVDEEPFLVEEVMLAGLSRAGSILMPQVTTDIAYRHEWLGEWYGRDVSVVDVVQHFGGLRQNAGAVQTSGASQHADLPPAPPAVSPPISSVMPIPVHAAVAATKATASIDVAAATRRVCESVAAVTGADEPAAASARVSELGLTSMQTVQLRDDLSSAFGLDVDALPVSTLLEWVDQELSIRQVAEALLPLSAELTQAAAVVPSVEAAGSRDMRRGPGGGLVMEDLATRAGSFVCGNQADGLTMEQLLACCVSRAPMTAADPSLEAASMPPWRRRSHPTVRFV